MNLNLRTACANGAISMEFEISTRVYRKALLTFPRDYGCWTDTQGILKAEWGFRTFHLGWGWRQSCKRDFTAELILFPLACLCS